MVACGADAVGRETTLVSSVLCFASFVCAAREAETGVLDCDRDVEVAGTVAGANGVFKGATALWLLSCVLALCTCSLGRVEGVLRGGWAALSLAELARGCSSPEEGTSHASKSAVGFGTCFGFGRAFLIGVARGVGS